MPGDCGLIGHIAGDIVETGWAQWQHRAAQFREDALGFLAELKNNPDLQLQPVNVHVDFALGATVPGAFVKPLAPALPELVFQSVQPPSSTALASVTPPVLDAPPEDKAVAPTLVLPERPLPLEAEPPGEAPPIDAVSLPAAPDLALPEVPTLRELALPEVPTLVLPAWSASAPSAADLVAPGHIFQFTEQKYSTPLLDELTARVRTMLAGGTGLPDAIWTALWDRARQKEEEAGLRLVQEATEEWAARGFSLPPGALAARVAAARQAVQSATATLAREIAVKQAEMEQANLQFAVAQGIALETLLLGQHNAAMQRAFEAARYAFEAAIHLYNARVALFNAELQAYQTEAQVYKTRIEAELARLEAYKAELEGQKLLGELNLQAVEIYKARLAALATEAEIYKTRVGAVEAAVRANALRIDAFKALIEAYGERVRAKSAETQQYAEAVRGELARAQVYELETNVFAKRIEAWRAKGQGQIEAKRIELETNEHRLRKYLGEIEAYRAQIGAEAERVRAGAGIYDARARLFTAEVQAESARLEGENQSYRIAFERGRTEAELEMKQAELQIEQLQRLLALELERIKTVNNVHAQLAAATMAAVNLSASVSEGVSNSASCNTSYSYDMTG